MTLLLLGTPADLNGDDLPEPDAPDPQPTTSNPQHSTRSPWHPFESQAHFELADFIFRQNEMPGAHIDELMHIWASMPGHDGTPPFSNHEHLYSSIDAISEGDAPWTSLSMESAEATSTSTVLLEMMIQGYQAGSKQHMRWFFVILKYYLIIKYPILTSRVT